MPRQEALGSPWDSGGYKPGNGAGQVSARPRTPESIVSVANGFCGETGGHSLQEASHPIQYASATISRAKAKAGPGGSDRWSLWARADKVTRAYPDESPRSTSPYRLS